MKYSRTFSTSKLYHKFLKPENIPLEKLPFLVSKLFEANFIELYHNADFSAERYSENEKLISKTHKDELFKIVQSLKAGL